MSDSFVQQSHCSHAGLRLQFRFAVHVLRPGAWLSWIVDIER